MGQISSAQKQNLQTLLTALDEKSVPMAEQEELVELLKEALDRLPDRLSETEKQSIQDTLESSASVCHKLKLTIPVLYPFISYEGEFGIEGKASVDRILDAISEKLSKMIKRPKA